MKRNELTSPRSLDTQIHAELAQSNSEISNRTVTAAPQVSSIDLDPNLPFTQLPQTRLKDGFTV